MGRKCRAKFLEEEFKRKQMDLLLPDNINPTVAAEITRFRDSGRTNWWRRMLKAFK